MRIQNPLQWSQDYFKRWKGRKIWEYIYVQYGGGQKIMTSSHWIKLKRMNEVPEHIAEQVEKLCAGAIVYADMRGAYVRTRSIFDNECQFMKQASEEELKNEQIN